VFHARRDIQSYHNIHRCPFILARKLRRFDRCYHVGRFQRGINPNICVLWSDLQGEWIILYHDEIVVIDSNEIIVIDSNKIV